MNRFIRPFLSVGIPFLLVGCTSTPQVTETAAPVTPSTAKLDLLYQANRYGSLEPCGCQKKPYGGIDREANALAGVRAKGNPSIYVDAGDLFAADEAMPEARTKRLAARADALVGMMNKLSLDAFTPGAGDFVLGLEALRSLALKSQFAWITSNVTLAGGAPLFPAYQLFRKGPLRIAVLGISTKPVKGKAPAGVQWSDPAASLSRWLPEVEKQSDIRVVLSQLTAVENAKLAEQFPLATVVVSADPTATHDIPVVVDYRTLVVDPLSNGFLLGHLAFDLKLPFAGFEVPLNALTDREERLKVFQKAASANPKFQGQVDYLQKEIASIQKNRTMTGPKSTYWGDLIQLDAERFGGTNELTQWLRAERDRLRKEARKR